MRSSLILILLFFFTLGAVCPDVWQKYKAMDAMEMEDFDEKETEEEKEENKEKEEFDEYFLGLSAQGAIPNSGSIQAYQVDNHISECFISVFSPPPDLS